MKSIETRRTRRWGPGARRRQYQKPTSGQAGTGDRPRGRTQAGQVTGGQIAEGHLARRDRSDLTLQAMQRHERIGVLHGPTST